MQDNKDETIGLLHTNKPKPDIKILKRHKQESRSKPEERHLSKSHYDGQTSVPFSASSTTRNVGREMDEALLTNSVTGITLIPNVVEVSPEKKKSENTLELPFKYFIIVLHMIWIVLGKLIIKFIPHHIPEKITFSQEKTVLKYAVLALICPPGAVYFKKGFSKHLLLNIILTFCLYLPGLLQAMYVVYHN